MFSRCLACRLGKIKNGRSGVRVKFFFWISSDTEKRECRLLADKLEDLCESVAVALRGEKVKCG